MITQSMRSACRIPRTTNTSSGCVMLTTLLLQQWLHESASMSEYTYTVFLYAFTQANQMWNANTEMNKDERVARGMLIQM